ncbi:hypothetical protein J7E26_13225 [Bacillus sp. ISL-51]|uniref:hypothetical protein n=1 Tax=Bacteria TaxID=2 RepID=UPI001BECB407|nr:MULTISPECIES: hypothetical protein [Bacteria]MBT2574904.1 hypothetical protein [Bacillus sp. ISL-51]MBT2634147.1 hypothetical protein [Bacillus sp. ISL-26]MBT2713712.1 hypothetical protein [Pseudomonas sp. ISL-88]
MDLGKNGGVVNNRRYSQHALERMAPNRPEVRAELFSRATKKAKEIGFRPQTIEYKILSINILIPGIFRLQ